MNALRSSIRVNNDLDTDTLIGVAKTAEDSGFDQVWCSNDLFLRSVMAMLPLVARETTRISLGTGIMNPYTMHTSEIAMFHRTLSELSGGRVLLGMAAGARDFLGWVGLEQTRPLSRMTSAFAELRHMLEGAPTPPGWAEGTDLPGEHEIPIYMGAMGPKMLALAGEVADGVLPLLFPPERFVEARQAILDGAAASGRAPEDIDVATCVWVSVSTDREEARTLLAHKIAYYGPSFSDNVLSGIGVSRTDLEPARSAIRNGRPEDVTRLLPSSALRLGIFGNSTDVIDRCEELMAIGARHISFGPPLGTDPSEAIRLLGNKVLPELRRLAI